MPSLPMRSISKGQLEDSKEQPNGILSPRASPTSPTSHLVLTPVDKSDQFGKKIGIVVKKEDIQPPPIYLSVETNTSEDFRSKNSTTKLSLNKFETVSKSPVEIEKIMRTLTPTTLSPSEHH